MTGPRDRVPPTGRVTRADLGRLGVPAATVRGWVHRGRLVRVGGSDHYPEYDAEAALALVSQWKPRGSDPA
ncbi:type IV toxin-antitoxin system AbiEi family antitoxin domain-containing protein [Kitasatospora sp. NPDC058444]|uniref:type IV toxin-antitoxin system AbiEi family antitoxin domain-containing protein n=1 Tax=Kitasatospora sp. NPDC058444 TaxID=3346504 RepID=UPI00366236A3